MIKVIKFSNVLATFSMLMLTLPPAWAGTIIEIKNNNALTTVLTDGKRARMNMGETDFVIVDFTSNSVKLVDPEKRQVTLLDLADMSKGSKAPKIQTSVSRLGGGPAVAGYQTQRFAYTVNGKSCGQIYGSKDAYQLDGVKELLVTMKAMMDRQLAMMGGFVSMVDDCTLGDIEMSKHVAAIGVPMRTEQKGVIDTEVKSIKLNAALPAGTFSIPASYKTLTTKEKQPKAAKDMAKGQQYQPQVKQQTQPPGRIPPHVMQRMRSPQQHWRRY